MKKKTRWPVIAGVAFIVLFVIAMIYSTGGNAKFRAEVCVTFNGRTNCRSAAAATMEEAERVGISNACADIASGVTETMGCEQSAPRKITWKK